MIELPLEFADAICGMQRKHKKWYTMRAMLRHTAFFA